LIGIAGKDIFRGNTGGIGLARNSIRNIKTRADIIAEVDMTITT
jgi:hypothetical protein